MSALWVLTGAVSDLHAQEIASSLNQLRVLVKVGDAVTVTDESGRETRGVIASLASDSLVLEGGGPGRTFLESGITTIRQRRADPLKNGTLWGLGIGGGLGLLGCAGVAAMADEYGFVPGCVLAYGGLGAAIGVGVDAMISSTRVIFSRPVGLSSRLSVSASTMPKRQGVIVSVRF